jgi:carbamoyltransferase
VRQDKQNAIPAAVHVDGTGRIQTVEKSFNARYYALIEEFGRLTGVPILLNTSFNRKEPIVARPEEAIECYLGSGMDVLVMGDFYTAGRPGSRERATDAGEARDTGQASPEPAFSLLRAPN